MSDSRFWRIFSSMILSAVGIAATVWVVYRDFWSFADQLIH